MVFSEIMCDGGHIRNVSNMEAIYPFGDVCLLPSKNNLIPELNYPELWIRFFLEGGILYDILFL